MALIRYGPTIADARGSTNGVVYSRNRSGAYTRARVKPTNPASNKRDAAQLWMRQCQTAFRVTLDATMRKSWQALADSMQGLNKLGDNIRLTAVNHFIAVNTLRLYAFQPILTTAPPPPAATDLPIFSITASGAVGLRLDSIVPAMGVGDIAYVRASGPHSTTRTRWYGPWPYRGFHLDSEILPWTFVDAADVGVGERWFIEWRYLTALGRLSSPYHINVLTV